jgi:hypothetical protein
VVLVAVVVACTSESKPPPAQPQPQPQPAPRSQPRAVPNAEFDATMVAPTALEADRIQGSITIVPDDIDKHRMAEHGLTRIIATMKLCLTATGEPRSVEVLRSSGLPGYDEKLRKRITAEWRYKPFEINGTPQPVCSAVTFIYNQPLPQKKPINR